MVDSQTTCLVKASVAPEALGPDELRVKLLAQAKAAVDAYRLEAVTQRRAMEERNDGRWLTGADICLGWEARHAGQAAKALREAGECPWRKESV